MQASKPGGKNLLAPNAPAKNYGQSHQGTEGNEQLSLGGRKSGHKIQIESVPGSPQKQDDDELL